MINVTKTFLPPLQEYIEYLERIWRNGQITNNGQLVRELEQALKEYLKVKHLFFVANGTLGLQLALRALDISGKVITTPFSYVASTGALLWERATPVFADVGSSDFCIDPLKVEAAIDGDTEAVLAVHVYGYPCDVSALAEIARRRGVKIIYDAAHAFGSKVNDKAVAAYGDISVLSFHATKLFHTVEGGAVVTNDDDIAKKIRLFRAFGHVGEEYFTLGINAKNSELHAAMGLCLLPRVPTFIDQRKALCERYDQLLLNTSLVRPQSRIGGLTYNHAYYPIVFPSEAALLRAKEALQAEEIIPRRYFYPPLNRLPYPHGESCPCPVAENVAACVLCLPLSYEITSSIQERIAQVVTESLGR